MNKVFFSAKSFESGIAMKFRLFDMHGAQLYNKAGVEIGDTGVYYFDWSVYVTKNEEYICIAHKKGERNVWQNFKHFIAD